MEAVLRLDVDVQAVEARPVGRVRYLDRGDVLQMKPGPVLSLDGFYGTETLTEEAAHLPAPDCAIDLHQRREVRAVRVPLGKNHPVPNLGVECDLHRLAFFRCFPIYVSRVQNRSAIFATHLIA